MTDRYLFKAKRIDNGEWVEGFYCIKKPYCFDDRTISSLRTIIIKEHSSTGTVSFEVNPDTVCQYTGLTDKNGNKIWENDVVMLDDELWLVKWSDNDAQFTIEDDCTIEHFGNVWGADCEVYGNSFDNPELLGEQNG